VSLFYTLAIRIFGFLVWVAAPFKRRARLWVDGRRGWHRGLKEAMRGKESPVWFHAASLGEFEEGRPIIERVREAYPDRPILLTFFSPSGYEVRKDFERVDHVHYLPLDTPGNARRFLDAVRPELAVFIRYEYWYNFLWAMFRRGIPVVMVSSIFRKEQIFFKPYGTWTRKALRRISHFFVQNEESLALLEAIGVENKELSGDTRFDRVWAAAREKRDFPLVERFLAGRMCLMAGSTWSFDDRLLKEIVPLFPDLKFVIVPHHVDEASIRRVMGLFGGEAALYSRGRDQELEGRQLLVVDTIGMLAYLYRLADLTYIGDGFGPGIHSVMEPAAFGMPIFFGPNYRNFQEAVDLVARGGAFVVRGREDLVRGIRRFAGDEEARLAVGRICREYIEEKRGATDRVMRGLVRFLGEPRAPQGSIGERRKGKGEREGSQREKR
jgi:3-deoxy-D-manno-octulosonic-acid transferase